MHIAVIYLHMSQVTDISCHVYRW